MKKNYYFHDANIINFTETSNGILNIILAYQISGNYEGGSNIIKREISLSFHEIIDIIGDVNSWNPECFCDEPEIDKIDDYLSISFYLPSLLTIKFKYLEYDTKDYKSIQKPWISLSDINISFISNVIPTPAYVLSKLENLEENNLTWRFYAGESTPSNEVPYPDYSGWFIQKIDRLSTNLHGILIFSINKLNEDINISFNLYDKELNKIMINLIDIFSDFNSSLINIGNVKLTKTEWLQLKEYKSLDYKGYIITLPNFT